MDPLLLLDGLSEICLCVTRVHWTTEMLFLHSAQNSIKWKYITVQEYTIIHRTVHGSSSVSLEEEIAISQWYLPALIKDK